VRHLKHLAAILVMTPIAAGGPLNPSRLPAEAQWVVHVDVERGLATAVGGYIRTHQSEFRLEGLAEFRTRIGVDPLKDIRDITVFGTGPEPESAVALIHTSAATDAFIERARGEEKTFKQVPSGGFTLDSWVEHGVTRYGFVQPLGEDERLILVSQDPARLAAAIQLVRVAPPAPPEHPLLSQVPGPGSVVFISARCDSLAAGSRTMFLQAARSLVVDAGEEAGEGRVGGQTSVYCRGRLTTASEQDAKDMLPLIQGSLAVARMAARQRPELTGLAEMCRSVSLGGEGATISGEIRYESGALIDMLKAAAAQSPAPAKGSLTRAPEPPQTDDRGRNP
jgi:hypothetical protein